MIRIKILVQYKKIAFENAKMFILKIKFELKKKCVSIWKKVHMLAQCGEIYSIKNKLLFKTIVIKLQSTLDITEPELNRILVITEHFLIPVTAQYLPMYFTFDANRIFLL